jgi:RNA recognition motif-containing protein
MRGTTLFVGGLDPNTTATAVAREFERFGKLIRCDIPTPQGRPRGFAFVEFENDADADKVNPPPSSSCLCGMRACAQLAEFSYAE